MLRNGWAGCYGKAVDCVITGGLWWFIGCVSLQEVWSRQQYLRDRELKKLTERLQKVREERERLSDEVKQLRDHNYSLMADINTLSQDKSHALLANRDLQIEVS